MRCMTVATETQQRIFIDTNVWLYAFIKSQDARKHDTARHFLDAYEIIISTQVISEVCVNVVKKAVFSE